MRCIPVSPLPASVDDDVSSAECDVTLLILVVVVEVVVTVVVSGSAVKTTIKNYHISTIFNEFNLYR